MNYLLLPILLLFAAETAGAELITKVQHDSMLSLSVSQLKDMAPVIVGKVVALHLNHRHEIGGEIKPGWFACQLGGQRIGLGKDLAHVRVAVPREGLKWLQNISTKTNSNSAYVVYGEVAKDLPEKSAAAKPAADKSVAETSVVLRLIGTNIRMQSSGFAEITW